MGKPCQNKPRYGEAFRSTRQWHNPWPEPGRDEVMFDIKTLERDLDQKFDPFAHPVRPIVKINGRCW